MKKLIYIALVAFCTVSCSDYLDIDPTDFITEANLYKNESGVKAALTELYIDLPIEDYRFHSSIGFNSNEYKNKELETLTGFALNRKREDVASIGTDVGLSWMDYSVVREINKYILALDKYSAGMTEDRVQAYQAEGYAIRAWTYFAMAKRFGGVPYVTDVMSYTGPEDLPAMKRARNSEEEIWDSIIVDIDRALALKIPETNSAGRINRATVLALKSRVALYAASIARYNTLFWTDENTGKLVCGIPASRAEGYYNLAYEAAYEIIKTSKYSLARNFDTNDLSENFRKMFLKVDSGTNKEAIFCRYFSYPDLSYRFDMDRLPWIGQSSPSCCPTVDLMEQYDYLDGTSGAINAKVGEFVSGEYTNREDFFKGRDARFLASVIVPGTSFMGNVLDVQYGIIDATGKELSTSKYKGKYGMGDDITTSTSMFQKKLLDDTKTHSETAHDSDQPWTEIRYAEVILNAAEAQIELGHPEIAEPYINDIRTRAGLKSLPLSGITRDEVRKQFICEFAFENKTFWNYRRWRIYDQIMNDPFHARALYPILDTRTNKWVFKVASAGANDLMFLPKYYYNKISTDEIKKNQLLVQNYGY